ncbi:substrate-binding domain-containing protein [uncultured Jatrophihabitans sp.]|uniref:substrate-binding domain-containing protein n=1 Tax=uncultured Jatrophihabitans sp. TaxID=1610747 RepID=UPI0035CBCAB8
MTRGAGPILVLFALIPLVTSLASGGAGASVVMAPAVMHAQIGGSGSSFAANALDQWAADTNRQGLQVVYTSSGSAQGRLDFARRTTDFAVTDTPYQGTDPVTGQEDDSEGRPYRYIPLVAGGVAFPYHLEVGGRLIRNLRLSGATLSGIFTGRIRYWDAPAIRADNNNRLALPHLAVRPVVHIEGSGVTYQFTSYLAHEYPEEWNEFSGAPTATAYFPVSDDQIAEPGSNAVINYVESNEGDGAIGVDEYTYALLANAPVAKIQNAAGYYAAPSAGDVTVALTQTQFNTDETSPDYLVADYSRVYEFTDPRTYPLSGYTYAVIPAGQHDTKTSTAAQLQTVADFMFYGLCQGQAEAAPIGYAPLPLALVQQGLAQLQVLHDADPTVDLGDDDIGHCANPTFAGDPPHDAFDQYPQPAACDAVGHGPCGTPADRTALTVADPHAIGYRHRTRIAVRLLDASASTALGGQVVVVRVRPARATAYHPLSTLRTDRAGRASLTIRAATNTRYQFDYRGDDEHAAHTAVVSVHVKQAVTIRTSARRLRHGHRLTVRGVIKPLHRRGVVWVQRKTRHGWRTLATARYSHRYRFRFTPRWRGRATLRVWSAATAANIGTSSAKVRVTVS